MRPFGALLVELQSTCNRTCPWCARTHDRSGARKDATGTDVRNSMPTEQAERILREAAALGFRGPVFFNYYSEPFLDPRLRNMVLLAKGLGLSPRLYTNGDAILASPEAAATAKLFQRVVVSLYEPKTAKELRNAASRFVTARPMRVSEWAHRGTVRPGPDNRFGLPAQPNLPCSRVLENLIVTYDGRLPICCRDMRAEFGLPNAFGMPVKDMWWHPIRKSVSAALAIPGGRSGYTLCLQCPRPCGNVGWTRAQALWGTT